MVPPVAPVVASPPLRADARRNRERVLEAARAAFAERGLDAQVEEIAREAGVGVGTVYRHFATKEGLLEAVALEPLGEVIDHARGALEREPPGVAFEGFMRWVTEKQVGDRCMGETGAGSLAQSEAVTARREELGQLVGELLVRAQAAGTIRDDLVLEDVPMLIFGIGAGELLDACMPYSGWRRHLEVVLDGIRAPARSVLAPPA